MAKLKEKLDDLGKEVQLNEKYVNDLDEKLNQLAKEHSDNLQKVDPGGTLGTLKDSSKRLQVHRKDKLASSRLRLPRPQLRRKMCI